MLSQWPSRIRAFLIRRQHDDDLRNELRSHIELETERNLSRGMSEHEASRVAHVAVGNLTIHAEDGRRAVTGIWFEQLVQDMRYAKRMLQRNRTFALVSILSLGFGIGATTTAFSAVDAVDLRPLPFRDAERLVFVAEVTPAKDAYCSSCSSEIATSTALDWMTQLRSYSATGALAQTAAQWTHDDAVEFLSTHSVTPRFFSVLGAPVAIGREFLSSDTLDGAAPVVIVSHAFWRQRLRADSLAVGRVLPNSNDPTTSATLRGATVIGVLPETFRFGVTVDRSVWLPLRLKATAKRDSRSVSLIARLRDNASVESANAELQVSFSRLAAESPKFYESWGARVEPLRARIGWGTGENRKRLLAITALVLLIAVINVAGLMGGRATARRQEFAMRSAFGASRRRLLRQLLVEGTLIGVGGAVVGILLARWGTGFSAQWFRIDPTVASIDLRVLTFALCVSIAAGILIALVPAIRTSNANLIGQMRGVGSSAQSRSSVLASGGTIIAQIALGLMLVAGATSLCADFIRSRYTDLGFDPHNLYSTIASMPRTPARDPAVWRQAAENVRAEIEAIPGVTSASVEYMSGVHPEIVRPADGEAVPVFSPTLAAVATTHFDTWKMELLQGRQFGAEDRAGAEPVAIVNESFANRFWAGQNPIGRRVFVGDSGKAGEVLTVVGVVRDVERAEMMTRHWSVVFRPLSQATVWHTGGRIQLRIAENANHSAVLRLAQTRVREAMQRPTEPFATVASDLDERLRMHRLNAIALTLFAAFGLALAALGVYAAIATAVGRRTREIGVRMALGAAPHQTLRLVLRIGFVLASSGIAIGLLGALSMSKILRSMVADTNVLDPKFFVGAAVCMMIAAGLASWIPARRVLRIDPVEALRSE